MSSTNAARVHVGLLGGRRTRKEEKVMKLQGSVALPPGAKLYYIRTACSLATHIVAREADLAIDLVQVDRATKKTETGEDYLRINPRGYVPALAINGELHTEVVALVQFLAGQAPQSTLLPAAGTMDRFRVVQWLNFVSSELHKVFSPWLWHAATAESTKQVARDKIATRFAELDALFVRQPYLTGDAFTVADAYAFTIVNWSNYAKLDLSPHPHVVEYMARVAARPRVREALEAERMILAAE
jgi:glutathione S-transferase